MQGRKMARSHVVGMDEIETGVDESRHAPAGALDLPRKFSAERDDLTLKLVVDSWRDVGLAPVAPSAP